MVSNFILEGTVIKKYLGHEECVRVPAGVQTISEQAFENCRSVRYVEIPDGVTEIGEFAFAGCSSLERVEIPGSVFRMGRAAFLGCESLKSVEIKDGVSYIGRSAFAECKSLENVEMPGSMILIDKSAFQNCVSLKSVEIPDGVTVIGESAFAGCSSLESVEMPESITDIRKEAFENCRSLGYVEIPDGVTEIGEGAFGYCYTLRHVGIPESVTSIGDRAFTFCSKLKGVIIPEGVVRLGSGAFEFCQSLEIAILPDTLRDVGEDVFLECESLISAHFPNHPDLSLSKVSFEDRFLRISEASNLAYAERESAEMSEITNRDLNLHLRSIAKAEEHLNFLKKHLEYLYLLEYLLYARELLSCDHERDRIRRNLEKYNQLNSNASSLDESVLLEQLSSSQVASLPSIPLKPSRKSVPKMPDKPQEPHYEKPGLFNKRKIEELNSSLRDKYESELLAYEAELKKVTDIRSKAEEEYEAESAAYRIRLHHRRSETERIFKENTMRLVEAEELRLAEIESREKEGSAPLAFVRQEIAAAEESAIQTTISLKALYAKGVIHPKYANLLAICTILDYLETGRCTELSGPDGAYNLYESEMRADAIINKLENIEDKLDDMRSVQYTAYAAIVNMKTNLSSINRKMSEAVKELSRMSRGIESIEKSSAATAYHAKVAAHYAKASAEIAAAPSFGIIW